MGSARRLPLSTRLRDGMRAAADWFLPPVCMCCHCPVDPRGRDFLCSACRRDLRPLEPPPCPCGTGDLPSSSHRDVCPFCCELPADIRGVMATVRSAYPYAGVAGDMVRNLKYRHHEHAGDALARMTVGVLGAHLTKLREAHGVDLVVPVPMHWLRRIRRGYNQADCIASPLAGLLGIRCDPTVVERSRRTPPQARRSSPQERLVNVAGAFQVPEPSRVQGRRLLLLDDVITTGATAATCARALREAGAAAVHVVSVTRAGA